MSASELPFQIFPFFANSDYGACAHEFDTTRKALDLIESLDVNPIDRLGIFDPTPTYKEAARIIDVIHDAEYVQAVRSGVGRLRSTNGFPWDEGIPTMALAHVAGMVAATQYALATGNTAGSASSGMHHASYRSGSGYCTFNGLMASAMCAIQRAAGRVLILDFDAHCGGGTQDIINELGISHNIMHVDVSVSGFDHFEAPKNYFQKMATNENYIARIRAALAHATKHGEYDLIIYNAGMDPINCGIDVKKVQQREKMVREFIANTPAVFGLAGGYTWSHEMGEVIDWHRITINEWVDAAEASC